ncbi:MAG: hypothetical protein U0231_14370 [Nitrospiraceae bacterium]
MGIKNVTVNEPFFMGHFPGRPVMPGVLILEALAQVGGVLAFKSLETGRPVVYSPASTPPSSASRSRRADGRCAPRSTLKKRAPFWKMKRAHVESELVCEAKSRRWSRMKSRPKGHEPAPGSYRPRSACAGSDQPDSRPEARWAAKL